MVDPISVVLGGAVVGAVANGLAEKAWDSATGWLKERFGSHAKEIQEQAQTNVQDFVMHLAIRLDEIDKRQQELENRASNVQRDPEFSAFLQKTILNAAQNSDQEKSKLLAELVAARLLSKGDSTLALASQLASDAITRCNRRHLEMMALCVWIDEIRPRDPLPTLQHFKAWLTVHLRPFKDFSFSEKDARHLVAIACASYESDSERSLKWALALKAGGGLVSSSPTFELDDVKGFEHLEISWKFGLAGVQLTSVGSIVGGLALGHIKGIQVGPPDWD